MSKTTSQKKNKVDMKSSFRALPHATSIQNIRMTTTEMHLPALHHGSVTYRRPRCCGLKPILAFAPGLHFPGLLPPVAEHSKNTQTGGPSSSSRGPHRQLRLRTHSWLARLSSEGPSRLRPFHPTLLPLLPWGSD